MSTRVLNKSTKTEREREKNALETRVRNRRKYHEMRRGSAAARDDGQVEGGEEGEGRCYNETRKKNCIKRNRCLSVSECSSRGRNRFHPQTQLGFHYATLRLPAAVVTRHKIAWRSLASPSPPSTLSACLSHHLYERIARIEFMENERLFRVNAISRSSECSTLKLLTHAAIASRQNCRGEGVSDVMKHRIFN